MYIIFFCFFLLIKLNEKFMILSKYRLKLYQWQKKIFLLIEEKKESHLHINYGGKFSKIIL